MDIGNKIKRLRIRNSLTQEELADRCELSKGFISQVERNLASPSIATLEDLLQCLGTDLKTFFNDAEDNVVVFTKEDQTADTYIERIMHELGPDYSIRMVTDDRLLQFSAVHSGISRVTAKEFLEELTRIGNEITEFVRKLSECKS